MCLLGQYCVITMQCTCMEWQFQKIQIIVPALDSVMCPWSKHKSLNFFFPEYSVYLGIGVQITDIWLHSLYLIDTLVVELVLCNSTRLSWLSCAVVPVCLLQLYLAVLLSSILLSCPALDWLPGLVVP